MSVPVIICPCINRFDLLERMVRSIDHPVDTLVIIDNSCKEYRLPPSAAYGHVTAKYIRPIINIGYGGGINAAISQTPDRPWWVFVNADIAFGPGDLAAIEAAMTNVNDPRFVCGQEEQVNPFALAALNREVVDKVGLFDEWSFFPAYFEDNDYFQRMKLNGISPMRLPLKAMHGDSAEVEHGSITIRSDPHFKERNSQTFGINRDHYYLKWGGDPGDEYYATPWNEKVPLSHIKVDLAGRARRQW
jgi:GT2 family glycosyltransferase